LLIKKEYHIIIYEIEAKKTTIASSEKDSMVVLVLFLIRSLLK
jgi:hypothetical protein